MPSQTWAIFSLEPSSGDQPTRRIVKINNVLHKAFGKCTTAWRFNGQQYHIIDGSWRLQQKIMTCTVYRIEAEAPRIVTNDTMPMSIWRRDGSVIYSVECRRHKVNKWLKQPNLRLYLYYDTNLNNVGPVLDQSDWPTVSVQCTTVTITNKHLVILNFQVCIVVNLPSTLVLQSCWNHIWPVERIILY